MLSLFDGMSCGQIALERAGIKVENYFASEIDKNSIKITQKNYPNTIQIGDIKQIDKTKIEEIGDIDLIMGGFPCRNLSKLLLGNKNAKKGLTGQSALFYKMHKIINNAEPAYFLVENVEGMDNKDKDIISELLGVQPILIDSALVSAQERKRYYWTNIPNVTPPADKNLYIKDILEDKVDEKYYYNLDFEFHGWDKRVIATLDLFNYDMLKRVYNPNNKAPTLTSCRGGHKQKKVFDKGRCRKFTPLEYERLQTVPDNYTEGVADGHRYNMLGDGWTVDVIAHIFKGLHK